MFSKILARRLALATMLVGAILLAGCATQGLSSVFTPRSSNARLIYNLTLTILGVAAVVFVVVEGMLLF
jgi:heme/copper-type cytochrome/quinol oxidase subunit 2